MCSLHRVAALKRQASFSGKTRSELLLPQHSGEPEPDEETSFSLQQQLPSLSAILVLLSLKVVFKEVHLQLLHADNFWRLSRLSRDNISSVRLRQSKRIKKSNIPRSTSFLDLSWVTSEAFLCKHESFASHPDRGLGSGSLKSSQLCSLFFIYLPECWEHGLQTSWNTRTGSGLGQAMLFNWLGLLLVFNSSVLQCIYRVGFSIVAVLR